jgi:hypothetical protein
VGNDPPFEPFSITSGPDGKLWFTMPYVPGTHDGKIGMIDPRDPHITELPLPSGDSYSTGITAGRDGNIWFVDYNANTIGRVIANDPRTDTIRQWSIPTPSSGVYFITTGPGGNLWFTEELGNKIGRFNINTETFQEMSVPTSNSSPYGIAVGPDGNIWFVEEDGNKIAKLNPFDPWPPAVTEFAIPTPASSPYKVAAGPDGNLWFVENQGNKVGKLYVLTATGVTLGEAVTAGQPLDAVVANFHDDEPGMLGSNYQVDIDWGDGTSSGRAWTAGGGNWVATGSHTYADPGHYDITATITDTHAPTGMTATAYSSVDVDPATDSAKSGRRSGFGAFADLTCALPTAQRLAPRLARISPAAGVSQLITRPAQDSPAPPLLLSGSSDPAAAVAALRHNTEATAWTEPPAWLDLAALDLMTRNLLA